MRIVVLSEMEAIRLNIIVQFLLDMGHHIPLVVTTPGLPKNLHESKMERFQKRLTGLNYTPPVLIITTVKILSSLLTGVEPDIVLTLKFPFRLPPSVLSLPRLGAVNFHPSMLPHYRGPNPIGWQILQNEPFMGLTFHRMSKDYDTGPIILQDRLPITEDDDIRSLVEKMFPGAIIRLLPEVLQLVNDGYPGIEQDHNKATYAPSFSETQRTIDWTKPTKESVRLVRAAAFHGVTAHTNIGSYRVFGCHWQSEKLGRSSQIGEEITRTEENTILVQTSDGCFVMTEYKRLD
jgi:methionyl-tRNA formyltransferase